MALKRITKLETLAEIKANTERSLTTWESDGSGLVSDWSTPVMTGVVGNGRFGR